MIYLSSEYILSAIQQLEAVHTFIGNHIEMLLSSRLNIITGDNGLGKTFLMDCAWWALTNTWTGNEARPKYAEGSKKPLSALLSQESLRFHKKKGVVRQQKFNVETLSGHCYYSWTDYIRLGRWLLRSMGSVKEYHSLNWR